MFDLAILCLVCVVPTIGFAFLIDRRRPSWSFAKTAFVAAIPLPLLVSLLLIYIIVDAARTPFEKCGVDACAMAIAFSAVGIIYCLAAYFVAAIIAAIVLRKRLG
ncbi:hypothetical protein [Sphingomonas sp.]|uniref:hypothetical protein n=1 Tax=Sphingomonas sp. TaxID=28214 RepID=UPI000DB6F5CC|nr:hypothetical protein [Sphingomonas sp.]PZU11662.1 MAG: hypothetical protein DI605_01370 [Sphingomonas sp.]